MRQESQSSINGINILPPRDPSSDSRSEDTSITSRLVPDCGVLDIDDFSRSRQLVNTNQTLHFEELY